MTDLKCQIQYYKGWDRKDKGMLLADILDEHFIQDLQRQYTYYGAHQADIIIEAEVGKAKQTLSRGQQKMILIALKLSQAALLEKQCVYLFDDLASELDTEHLNRLLYYFDKTDSQIIITSTNKQPFEQLHASFFTMSEGMITADETVNFNPPRHELSTAPGLKVEVCSINE